MRILVVGAGATGGYFGGRLAEAGRDVTFLVRPRRAEELRRDGLRLVSPHGDATVTPKIVTADAIGGPYDVVLLTVKAYALEPALADIAPAIGPGTMIFPVLNGMRHLDKLVARFGEQAVIGGVCIVATTLDAENRIVQLAEMQELTYGERDGTLSPRIQALDAALQGAGFKATASGTIMQAMWDKWVFLASLGAICCLLRGTVGEIEAAGGADLARRMMAECTAVARASGYPPGEAFLARIEKSLTTPGSPQASSMYRDLVQDKPVEAEQIVGDMLARANAHGLDAPLLAAAYASLRIYQARIARG
jgi:2-dehydropantoate 2-reductase